MTVDLTRAAYALDGLTSAEVNVLTYLTFRANSAGKCWPSRATIAQATRLHPDTVKTVLQGLADPARPGGALIRKEVAHHKGRQIPSTIAILFDPVSDANLKGGDTPPGVGATDPHVSNGDRGRQTPDGGGASDPLEEDKPLEDSLGAQVRRLVETVWEIACIRSRRRSGKGDVARAIARALKEGAAPPDLIAGVRAYFADPEPSREDGRYAMALHRLIEQDRWREWFTPAASGGNAGPSRPNAGPSGLSPAELADIGTFAAPGPRMQRSWMDDWRRGQPWPDRRGPEPGQPGCRISPDLLRQHGVQLEN